MYSYELLIRKPPTIEERISKYLYSLSVPANVKGYEYLAEAIRIAALEPGAEYAISKKIFPRISETYGTTVQCIESSIRRAISKAWVNGDPDVQYDVFRNTVDFSHGRPCEAEFIALLAHRVRLEANDNINY